MSTRPIKEIAKIIKNDGQLATKCKLSVSVHSYSGGCSVNISLMEAPFKVFKEPVDGGHMQVNHFYIGQNDKITPEAAEALLKIRAIEQSFNYDNSDAMSDYFDVGFYTHYNIGAWNKPVKEKY